MKVINVIQARMGSSRLPGKSMMELSQGMSLIEMVIRRAMKSKLADLSVLATSDNDDCDPLCDIADKCGCKVVRGSETDVLSRFIKVVEIFRPDAVVRICADNPFVSSEEIDRLVEFIKLSKLDYSANNRPGKSGYGSDAFGAEVFLANLLGGIPENEIMPTDREHVTAFFLRHPERYKISYLPPAGILIGRLPKLDLDSREDFYYIRKLIMSLPSSNAPYWSTDEIISAVTRVES